MNKRAWDYYFFSVAVILFVTAAAKIFSATGTADALGNRDPLIPLSTRLVFYLASGVELFVSAFLLMERGSRSQKASLTAWLATNYLGYRVGLWWVGAPVFCDCLGNLNEKLFISPRTIDLVMFACLGWMIAGSYIFLGFEGFTFWRVSRLKATLVSNKGKMQSSGAYGD